MLCVVIFVTSASRAMTSAAGAVTSQPNPLRVARPPQPTRSTAGGLNVRGGGQAARIRVVRDGHMAEQHHYPRVTKPQTTAVRKASCAAEAGKSLPNPLDVARLPQPTVTPAGGGAGVVPMVADKERTQPDPPRPPSLNNDVIKAASKIPASVQQTPKPPARRRVSSSSSFSDTSSSPLGSATTILFRELLDTQLRDRLCELRLSPDEVSHNKHIVKELRENILEELTKYSHRLYAWETMNSGSYYDKTKVRWHRLLYLRSIIFLYI